MFENFYSMFDVVLPGHSHIIDKSRSDLSLKTAWTLHVLLEGKRLHYTTQAYLSETRKEN